jgi:hypothetical protein
MSKLDALLDAEAEHAEKHRDAPAKPGTRVSKPGHTRSTVFSVRLNADELAALEAVAEDAGLPASTLARAWILERLKYSGPEGLNLRKLVRDEVDRELRRRTEQAANAIIKETQQTGSGYDAETRLRSIIELLSGLSLRADMPILSIPAPSKPEEVETNRA